MSNTGWELVISCFRDFAPGVFGPEQHLSSPNTAGAAPGEGRDALRDKIEPPPWQQVLSVVEAKMSGLQVLSMLGSDKFIASMEHFEPERLTGKELEYIQKHYISRR